MKKALLKFDVPILIEECKGWEIFKEFPNHSSKGYDPASVIYYTRAKTFPRVWEHFGYSIEGVKECIAQNIPFKGFKKATKRSYK